MLPSLEYKKVLRTVKFPVYVISSDEVSYEDGLLFINGKVVDDRNQEGETLGQRRLRTPHKVAKLGNICFTFIEMLDSRKTKFIDTKGKVFEYKKTKMLTVKSFKISKKIARDTYTLLRLKKVNSSFPVPRYPNEEWAQVLVYNNVPWRLYSLSYDFVENFKRKI